MKTSITPNLSNPLIRFAEFTCFVIPTVNTGHCAAFPPHSVALADPRLVGASVRDTLSGGISTFLERALRDPPVPFRALRRLRGDRSPRARHEISRLSEKGGPSSYQVTSPGPTHHRHGPSTRQTERPPRFSRCGSLPLAGVNSTCRTRSPDLPSN